MNTTEIHVGDVLRIGQSKLPRTVASIFEYEGTKYCILAHKSNNGLHNTMETYRVESIIDMINLDDTHKKYERVVFIKKDGVMTSEGEMLCSDHLQNKKSAEVAKTCKNEKIAQDESDKFIHGRLCSKAQFRKYREVQISGKINMCDINLGKVCTGLREEEYMDIIWHYSEYKTAFGI